MDWSRHKIRWHSRSKSEWCQAQTLWNEIHVEREREKEKKVREAEYMRGVPQMRVLGTCWSRHHIHYRIPSFGTWKMRNIASVDASRDAPHWRQGLSSIKTVEYVFLWKSAVYDSRLAIGWEEMPRTVIRTRLPSLWHRFKFVLAAGEYPVWVNGPLRNAWFINGGVTISWLRLSRPPGMIEQFSTCTLTSTQLPDWLIIWKP